MKFHIHEIAVLVSAEMAKNSDRVWSECEIVEVSPFHGAYSSFDGIWNASGDYVVLFADGVTGTVNEGQLRKRQQPGIPESITRIFEEPVSA